MVYGDWIMSKKGARKFRLLSDKRAVSPAISSVIMAGAIIIVGFSVLGWTFNQSADFNHQYAKSMQTNLDKLREKLVFEHVFYNASSNETNVYLFNCGETPQVSLESITLRNSSWHQSVSSPQLMFLNSTQVQSLNVDEEGRFRVTSALQIGASYTLSISTGRGKSFVTKFVA
jgi:hypothetical protein